MNAFFHKGYFKEIFRQLRVAGLVSAGVLALFTLTGLLSDSSNNLIPSANSMAVLPMLYVYVMGITLTFSAYKWLNKRANSDFYHALPVSRRAMFFSTFAAIMLWILIGLACSAVVKTFLNVIMFRPFNYLLYICVLINVIISAVTIVAACSLACALCGTGFVRGMAALVILFLLRIMLTIFGWFLMGSDDAYHLVLSNVSFLFNPSFNIAGTYPYVSILGLTGGAIDFANAAAMVYSFLYAVLLLLCGCRAFVKRKSEDAGTPTASHALQVTIACAFGMPLLLVWAAMIVSGAEVGAISLGGFFLVLFAFVAFCLYNLISTKSFKKMCKAMPYFGICVVVALLYCFLPQLVAKAELGIKVAEDDVKSYTVDKTGDDGVDIYDLFDSYFSEQTYSEMQTKKLSFNDPRSIKIIANAIGSDWEQRGESGGYVARIRVDRRHGKDLVRNVYFTEREWKELQSIWQSNEDYINARTEYPKGKLFYNCSELDSKQAAELGKLFEEEYAKLTPEQIEDITNDYGSYYRIESALQTITGERLADMDAQTVGALVISGCLGTQNYMNSYSITSLTPKTADRYVQLVNEKNFEKGFEKLQALGEMLKSREEDRSYFEVRAFHTSSGQTADLYYWEMYESGVTEEYAELMDIYLRGTRAEESRDCVALDCSDGYGRSYSFFIKLSPEDEARAEELLNAIEVKLYGNNVWGSFTDGAAISYDGKFFAVYDVDNDVTVTVFDSETGDDVYSFIPARAVDFYGICWEMDSYNIWIQSGDVGVQCYRYEDGVWSLDESAVRPDYIISIYD